MEICAPQRMLMYPNSTITSAPGYEHGYNGLYYRIGFTRIGLVSHT